MKFLGAASSSRLKQQHRVHEQGQHFSAPCKSLSSFQRGTRLSKCLPRQQPFYLHGSLTMHRKVRFSIPFSSARGNSIPLGEQSRVGCCRNKHTVITLGITALWMSCALSKLQKSLWHDRYHSSLVAKPSCSCYGDILGNLQGAALAETCSIWLILLCRTCTSENFAEVGDIINKDGKKRSWKASFTCNLLV